MLAHTPEPFQGSVSALIAPFCPLWLPPQKQWRKNYGVSHATAQTGQVRNPTNLQPATYGAALSHIETTVRPPPAELEHQQGPLCSRPYLSQSFFIDTHAQPIHRLDSTAALSPLPHTILCASLPPMPHSQAATPACLWLILLISCILASLLPSVDSWQDKWLGAWISKQQAGTASEIQDCKHAPCVIPKYIPARSQPDTPQLITRAIFQTWKSNVVGKSQHAAMLQVIRSNTDYDYVSVNLLLHGFPSLYLC